MPKVLASLLCIFSVLLTSCASQQVDHHKTQIIDQIVRSVPIVLYGPSIGSGVLFTHNGKPMMLTAAHVLDDTKYLAPITINPTDVPIFEVHPIYGTQPITVVGYEPNTGNAIYSASAKIIQLNPVIDYAILELNCMNPSMSFASFSYATPQLGDDVYVVGSPAIQYGSLTKGIISHAARKLYDMRDSIVKYIQTDAAGGPGSSGGGLFACENGDCLGIVALKNESIGMLYAIPIKTIQEDLNLSLIEQFNLTSY